MNRKHASILATAFALGFSCITTQLALMREMLGVFAGNELVLGVALGNWLLLMGLGAALGRRVRSSSPLLLASLLVVTAILPPLQTLALRELRHAVFLPGEAIGATATVVTSFVLLFPYCVAAGLLLTAACVSLDRRSPASATGSVYAMDSAGGLLGGVLFSFILVIWLDHVALLLVPAGFNLLAAAWVTWETRACHSRPALLLLCASLCLISVAMACLFLSAPDAWSTARQFPGQQVLYKANSPYGRLVVTEASGQTNVIENGVVLVSTPNIEQAEESAHFAMAQRPSSRNVLLVGGTLSGSAREVLRYNVTTVDCVELDPLITTLGRGFFPDDFRDPRLLLHEMDARQFVRRSATSYDVILVALPDPTTAQVNRFFTQEFFQEARRILKPGGVLSFAIGRYENFAGSELTRVLSCARATARESFRNVLLVPAGRVYFLASDGPLTADISSALGAAGVARRWMTTNYLTATLTPDRLQDIARASERPAPVNRDFAPVLYYLHLRYWASQFKAGTGWLLMLFTISLAIYAVRLGPAARLIFASGFASSALEVVLLLAMQTLAGSVYRQVAWVVTAFMAGLAVGAWMGTRRIEGWAKSQTPEVATIANGPHHRRVIGDPCAPATAGSSTRFHVSACALGLSIAACVAILPAALPLLARLIALPAGPLAAQTGILLLTFCLAGLVGAQFPFANAIETASHPASRLYTADFVGASAGALATSVWLLPLLGVNWVSWIGAGLNVIAVVLMIRKKASA